MLGSTISHLSTFAAVIRNNQQSEERPAKTYKMNNVPIVAELAKKYATNDIKLNFLPSPVAPAINTSPRKGREDPHVRKDTEAGGKSIFEPVTSKLVHFRNQSTGHRFIVSDTPKEAHYKLINKAESYSKDGFGNGFLSKADRFSGKNELKYVYKPPLMTTAEVRPKEAQRRTKIMRLRRKSIP